MRKTPPGPPVMWKISALPKAALLVLLVPAFSIAVMLFGKAAVTVGLWVLVAALPVGILTLMGWVTMRVKKAEGWQEGRARITKSQVQVERHRLYESITRAFNKAVVAYEFRAGPDLVRGNRICLGIALADTVGQILKRYPVGAETAVFYDPANPQDCVLERQPSASLGRFWAGVLTGVVLYGTGVFCVTHADWIIAFFGSVFPQIHHPAVVLLTGLLGLLFLAGGIYRRLHPRQTMPWSRTRGVIVSSAVETFQKSHPDRKHLKTQYHQAVIEFSYKIDGHKYHGTSGGKTHLGFTMAGERSAAEREAARYPKGKPVDVFYNPEDATQSSLQMAPWNTLNGTPSLVLALILLTVAVYAATH